MIRHRRGGENQTRYGSSEDHAKSQSDGVSESQAKITDGEAKDEAAYAPKDSPENGEEDAAVIVRVGGMEDSDGVRNEDAGEAEGSDNPGGESLDEPVDLP